MLDRRQFQTFAAGSALLGAAGAARAQQPAAAWDAIRARARGQTVHWNAWAGDERTNDFIAWVGERVRERDGVVLRHVRLQDTAEAVAKVVAEKAAGRDAGGSVDLIWINGPNFLSMKRQGLLAPSLAALPNARLVDTRGKPSNVVDFGTPVDGLAVPWRLAQLVFVIDSARAPDPASWPRSADAMLAWARRRPGRLTHPQVGNYLGASFLKQMLVDLVADPAVLQQPAEGAAAAAATAPLWAWYDAIRPHLWRQGRQFPDNGPAQRQLLADGEIDITVSFDPAEAAVSAQSGLLPPTVRVFGLRKGTISNTSFVAVPANAAHRDGALVVADFLLSPQAQAHALDVRQTGAPTVLDLARLSADERRPFDRLPGHPALPSPAELGPAQLEPHASWMTLVAAEWSRRTAR